MSKKTIFDMGRATTSHFADEMLDLKLPDWRKMFLDLEAKDVWMGIDSIYLSEPAMRKMNRLARERVDPSNMYGGKIQEGDTITSFFGINLYVSDILPPGKMVIVRKPPARPFRPTATEVQRMPLPIGIRGGWGFLQNLYCPSISRPFRFSNLFLDDFYERKAWSWVKGFWRRLWNRMIFWAKWSWRE